jgi:hypothetical protein
LIGVAGIAAAGAVYKVFHATAHAKLYFLVGLVAGLAVLVGRG